MQFAVWHTEISNSTEYLRFKSGIPPTFPQKQHLSIYFMMKVGIAVCLPNSTSPPVEVCISHEIEAPVKNFGGEW